MLLMDALRDSTFVLFDIDKNASDRTAAFLERLKSVLGTRASFLSTDERAPAFEGADYFVITISTGGLKSMSRDLAVPEEYGIFHTVGDTSGPGGWARTIRNFDVFRSLASDFDRYAPGAVVLNYSNPMGTLTSVLARLYRGPVVGLCHGLFENLKFFTSYYRLGGDELSVKYGGLNHFFWITEAKTRDCDIFSDLKDKVGRVGFTALLKEASGDPMGFRSNRELATALFRETGVMPYLGDRHTCEFFPFYITNRAAMEEYKLVRTDCRERQEKNEHRKGELEGMISGEIPDEYRKGSRETAGDIISAHAEGTRFIDVGNVPNVGQIDNLPLGTVVETAVCVDRNGFSPIIFGSLPEPVLPFVEICARVFDMTVESCFQGSRENALRALRLDPVCSHLTGGKVREMGEKLLKANEDFLPKGF